MGAYASIDVDLQDLVATIFTLHEDGHDLANSDSEAGLDGRAVLLSRLTALGWLTPTERTAAVGHFNKGDGKQLLAILGGQTVGS
jgi:hypothetical protein